MPSNKPRRDEVIEEVEWLLSFGVVPQEIAQRLGYSNVNSLRRVCDKYGAHHLSVKLDHLERTYIECHKDFVKKERSTAGV